MAAPYNNNKRNIMASYNDITGNCLVTKPATEEYRNNYDAIFGSKKKAERPTFPELPDPNAVVEAAPVVAAEPQVSMKETIEARTKIRFVSAPVPTETTAEEDEAWDEISRKGAGSGEGV
jgi:type IV secretory pathway VirB10-like protein